MQPRSRGKKKPIKYQHMGLCDGVLTQSLSWRTSKQSRIVGCHRVWFQLWQKSQLWFHLPSHFSGQCHLAFQSLGMRAYIIAVSLCIGQLTLTRPVPRLRTYVKVSLMVSRLSKFAMQDLFFQAPSSLVNNSLFIQ